MGGACDTVTPTLDYMFLGGHSEDEEGLAQTSHLLHACHPPTQNVHMGPLWPPVCQEMLGAYSFNSASLIFDKT